MTTTPITALAEQLDKTLVAHNQADRLAIAAYHSKDELQHEVHHAEMQRLEKVEHALQRTIGATRAMSKDEAIAQLIVASQLVRRVSEGARRKLAARAFVGLLSAISALIDDLSETTAPNLRRRYFDTPAKQRLSEIEGGTP
jgi:hypothetical protein